MYLWIITPAEQAEEAGFDLSLIDESLRLEPEQRLRQHQAALELVIAVKRAGADLRERSQQSVAAP